jgi:membrane protease YdiL (CAAX protease family)
VGQPIAFIPVVARLRYGVELNTEYVLVVATAVGLFAPAVVITGIVDGRAGVRALLRAMVRFDVPLRWYSLAFVIVPVVVVLTPPRTSAGPASVVAAYLTAFLPGLAWQFITTNWWEETVWTGFFQSRLAAPFGAWRAALITTPFVAFQHVSLVFDGSVLEGVVTFVVLTVVILFARALFGWIYHRTGSLATTGLVHAAANAAAISLVPRLYGESGQGAVALFLLGALALAVTRGRLGQGPGRRPASSEPAARPPDMVTLAPPRASGG